MRSTIISFFIILGILLLPLNPIFGQIPDSEVFNVIAAQDLNSSTVGSYNQSEWYRDWNSPTWHNGLDNMEIDQVEGNKVLKFNYPMGSVGPHEGGAQWLASFSGGLEEVYFSYNLMFKPDFEWVLGGKLPGLGGGNNPGGGRDMLWDDGFSARIMWSKDSGGDGTMFFYVYHQDKPGYYGDVLSFPNAYWDVSDSTWYNMTIRLVINSIDEGRLSSDPQNAGNHDGILEFFLDGELVLSRTGLRFRNLKDIRVDTRHLTSFFGGGTSEWGNTRDEWVLFDDSFVFTYQDGVDAPRGRTPSQPGRVLQLPNLKGDQPNPADEQAPSIPSNLRLIAATGQSLDIAWDASTDNVFLKGYRIMLNGAEVGTTVGTTYAFSGLQAATPYNITISAFDASENESGVSTVLVATTLDPDTEPPSMPGGLLAFDQTQNSASISWTASTDNVRVSEYKIHLDGDWIGSTPNTTFPLVNLEPSSSYTVTISALDEFSNESALSAELEVLTKDPDLVPPSKPEGILATLITQNSIGLTWNPSTDNVGVAGYRLYLNGNLAISVPSNSYTFSALNPGIEYSIRVVAYDASSNESLPSDIQYIRTKNPDETSVPAMPDVEIVEIKTTSSYATMRSTVNSFGHTVLKDYGMVVSTWMDSISEDEVIYATKEDSEVIHPGRVVDNLQVLFDFSEGEGNQVTDISGTGTPINLVITDPLTIDWLPGQGLSIKGNSNIFSEEKPDRLIESLTETNEITMEAWVRSDEIFQDGPARLISLSRDNFHRAATLAYEGNNAFYNYVGRLNTTNSDVNGTPQIATDQNFISLNLHHVAYTRDSSGIEKIFVNGVELMSGLRLGDFSTMTDDYRLSLSNEIGGGRPWLGNFYLAAIYNKALSTQEVLQNFEAGPGEIQFTLDIPVEPNQSYDLSPFARTDQGVVYGDIESLEIKNVLVRTEEDSVYMAIYPNPSDGDFKILLEYPNIGTPQVSVRISDMQGRLVLVREIFETDEFVRIEETFEESSILSNGIYAVLLVVGNRSIARRLLIAG